MHTHTQKQVRQPIIIKQGERRRDCNRILSFHSIIIINIDTNIFWHAPHHHKIHQYPPVVTFNPYRMHCTAIIIIIILCIPFVRM